jgi:hypothetical protein
MTRVLLVAALLAALVPPTASASTVSYDGDTLIFQAAPGVADTLVISSSEPGTVSLTGDFTAYPTDRCRQTSPEYPLHCDVPRRVRADLGDGDDTAVVDHMAPAGLVVEIAGGDGDDDIKAISGQTHATFDGGPGADRLRSEDGDDVLIGGDGHDELIGGGGNDVLLGQGGDDLLRPDAGASKPGADLVDGGPGFDTVDDWVHPDRSQQRPITLTLDAVANDGAPGEGDDVRNVERVIAFAAGTYVMDDAANHVEVFAPPELGRSTVFGAGGDDRIIGGNGEQTLDGGPGDDYIEGGYGDDTLVGGPGRDTIVGDSASSQCGVLQSCVMPFGNDTIDARDGEPDSVSCGVGYDRVFADAFDTVASDCEYVERSAAPAARGRPEASTPGARVSIVRLATALRHGLRVRLSGMKPGRRTVVLRHGALVAARGAARVSKQGRASLILRFGRAARHALAGRQAVRLTLSAGPLRQRVTLRR